ncbi:MAG: ParB/RepB/Spo0J family partition protein [candidate division WOR-3 bacterium]
MTKKVLGKGLAALLSEEGKAAVEGEIRYLKVEEIQFNPYQPRENPEEDITEMVNSVKQRGILQPILVRRKEGGYELIAGERRLRAAKEAGLSVIPAVIKETSESEALELALIENLLRKDLNPLEEALAYKRLVEEFHLTQEEIAERVNKSRSAVANALRLLTLPPKVRDYLKEGKITAGHARALLMLNNRKEQEDLCERIIRESLSVRQVEKLTSQEKRKGGEKEMIKEKDAYLQAMEDLLREYLGTNVSIIKRGERGQIVIEFLSDEDFNRIIRLIKR